MQSGLQLCIGRFKARLNWRWLSKARDSYGFMSCVAQMLILCRYKELVVTYVLCVCRFSLLFKSI